MSAIAFAPLFAADNMMRTVNPVIWAWYMKPLAGQAMDEGFNPATLERWTLQDRFMIAARMAVVAAGSNR